MSNPFKLVGLAPHLSLQACLACESKLLPFDNLIGGFRTMAKSPHFYYSMVSVIQTLCDEMVVNSKSWIRQDWAYPSLSSLPCPLASSTPTLSFFYFHANRRQGVLLPLPLAVLSDLVTSNSLHPAFVRITANRVKFVVGTLDLEGSLTPFMKKIDSISDHPGQSPPSFLPHYPRPDFFF